MKVLEKGRPTETKNSVEEPSAVVETNAGVCAANENPTTSSIRLPLMSGQRQLWVGQQLDPESRAFNTGGFAIIKGPLNVAMFQQAAAACIAETEGLRLRFLSDIRGPYQELGPQAGAALKFIDQSNEPDPLHAAMAWMQKEISKELKLELGPTFSWALLQLAQDQFIFCTIYHHLVMDGMSSLLLVRRTRHLYEAIRTESTAKPINVASIASLVESEESYRSSERFAVDRDYWLNHLQDRPGPVSLSKGSKRSTPTWESHCASIWLPSAAVDCLVKQADELKTSLSRLLMGAVAMVVNRLTGSSDFLMGMVVTGRGGRFRNIPANLTHILPLRLRLSGELRLRDCVDVTAREMEGANTHKLYQMNDIRNDLGLRPNHPGLFGIEVNIMPFFFNDCEGGLAWSIHSLSLGPVEGLCISIRDRGEDGRLRIDFNGNKGRYEITDLLEIASRFETMLGSIANASPDATLSEISALGMDERRQVVEEFNRSQEGFAPRPCRTCSMPRWIARRKRLR